jgi:hypothetical protein
MSDGPYPVKVTWQYRSKLTLKVEIYPSRLWILGFLGSIRCNTLMHVTSMRVLKTFLDSHRPLLAINIFASLVTAPPSLVTTLPSGPISFIDEVRLPI